MSTAPAESPRRGRPPRLDLDRIVAIAGSMPPERLTMAAVAERLQVSTSALYRWVADREALLDLVSIHTARHITPPWSPDRSNWREWLFEWAHNTRRELGSVRGYALRVLTGPHRAAGHDELQSAAVAAFVAGGAGAEQAEQYWYAFSAAVLGWITVEQSGTFPTTATPMDFSVLLEVLLRGTDPDN